MPRSRRHGPCGGIVLLSGILDVYDDTRFGAMKEMGQELETFPVEPGFALSKALEQPITHTFLL